jgi:glucokinase
MIGGLLEKLGPEPPVGIGIGATGPIDPEQGQISNRYTLPAAFQGPVAAGLAEAFGLPVRLENDADAAALGESWTGSAAGTEVAACITVGTGIGCGVVRRGRIFRGAHGSHPEFGHHVVDPSGPACYCGAHGCVESLASAPAITRAAIEAGAVAAGAQAADVFAAAVHDTVCCAIVERAQFSLASAVVNLVALQAPEVIVVTGNGIGNPEALVGVIGRRLADYAFTPPGGVRVSLSRLGRMAGCIGAARLAFEPEVWA